MPEGQRNSSGPLLQAIREKLMAYRYKPGDQAGKGFAVNGSGLDALKEAKETIAGVRRRPEKLPAGEVTLVFYASPRSGCCRRCHRTKGPSVYDQVAFRPS